MFSRFSSVPRVQMKDQLYFHRLKDNHLPFVDDDTLFRFQVCGH